MAGGVGARARGAKRDKGMTFRNCGVVPLSLLVPLLRLRADATYSCVLHRQAACEAARGWFTQRGVACNGRLQKVRKSICLQQIVARNEVTERACLLHNWAFWRVIGPGGTQQRNRACNKAKSLARSLRSGFGVGWVPGIAAR
jgi:hypothetical protein